MPREFDFIQWVQAQQAASQLVPVPAGDDMAVINWPAADLLLVGVDQVLDSVHFESRIHSPRAIGQKVMNRNLSDCAAMGCLPAAAVATVALPRGTGMDYIQELYAGARAAADAFNCAIVGGDTGSWDGKLVVTVTILGRSAGVKPVTRAGAIPGDGIYVSGPLGGSILGRHMNFVPRVELGRRLAQTALVSAMIDISDGLSRDLAHICRQSRVGALIDAGAIPIHPDAVELSSRDATPAIDHALNDGEDHELLCTSASPQMMASLGMIRIGAITPDGPPRVDRGGQIQPLEPKGWEHSL